MPLWMSLARAAFIGGSLVDGIGGHNPIEASRLELGVITGPFTASFADIYAAYDTQEARLIVRDAAGLAEAVEAFWDERGPSPAAAETAIDAASGGALATTLTALTPLLPDEQEAVR